MNVIPTPKKDKNGGADYKLQVKQRSEGEADRKEKSWKNILENEHRATRPKQESQETRKVDSRI